MAPFVRTFVALFLMMFALTPALAWNPGEALEDPLLETRARAISAELRCLVCQNQSIDDSDADLARDLRVLVRERLVAGDSDRQVYDYVVARYGEFVLLRPRIGAKTVLLWGLPLALLAAGCGALLIGYRRRSNLKGLPALSESEKKRIAEIVEGQ